VDLAQQLVTVVEPGKIPRTLVEAIYDLEVDLG
jgi:hypothetical protein